MKVVSSFRIDSQREIFQFNEFTCMNNECWVSEYQADVSATGNIVGRLNPWGERLSLKSTDDDTPRDGNACDSTTGHRMPSPKLG